jgi:voltage-gated potassium channel
MSEPVTPEMDPEDTPLSPLRERLWRIIFRSDTPAGRYFDLALLVLIGASVAVVMLDSVPTIAAEWSVWLWTVEWIFTMIFTVEFLVRLWVTRVPRKYATSFFGIVDLLSILPGWLQLMLPGTHYLMVVRVLRLLRIFRILKMAHHIDEAGVILSALRASRNKIFVFLFSVCTLVCVEGTIVYVIESPYNEGFESIPQAIYWAVVTITTVGYGDVAPITFAGKLAATVIMLTGFAILAVPTGVVTAELGRQFQRDDRTCRECGKRGHDPTAHYCMNCGERL